MIHLFYKKGVLIIGVNYRVGFFFSYLLFLIGGQLLYKVVLLSAVQQLNQLYIYIHPLLLEPASSTCPSHPSRLSQREKFLDTVNDARHELEDQGLKPGKQCIPLAKEQSPGEMLLCLANKTSGPMVLTGTSSVHTSSRTDLIFPDASP